MELEDLYDSNFNRLDKTIRRRVDEIDVDSIEYDTSEVININWYSKEEIINKIKDGKVNKGYAYILERYL